MERVLLSLESQQKNEAQIFRLLIFKDSVAVAIPRVGDAFSALCIKKLLQHFFEPKLSENIFFEQFPVRGSEALPRVERNFRRAHILQIKIGLHDLLRRNGRPLEEQMQILPAVMHLQELLRKRGAREIRKEQAVADVHGSA